MDCGGASTTGACVGAGAGACFFTGAGTGAGSGSYPRAMLANVFLLERGTTGVVHLVSSLGAMAGAGASSTLGVRLMISLR